MRSSISIGSGAVRQCKLSLHDALMQQSGSTQSTKPSVKQHIHHCMSHNLIRIIIIIRAFIMRASSVMILNQRRWQSLGGQHGKGVDGLFEKASFQTAFEGVESG